MATSAQSISTNGDDTMCQICFELYNTPKLLLCGHLLCKTCILDLVEKNGQQTICPFCRRSIVQPSEHNAQWSVWVNQLPTDLSTVPLVEKERVLKGNSMCVCNENAAVSYCVPCGELYCQMCTRAHKIQRATKDHNIKAFSQISAEELGVGTVVCENHHKVSLCSQLSCL